VSGLKIIIAGSEKKFRVFDPGGPV